MQGYAVPIWMTFKQAQELKASVGCGACQVLGRVEQ
jgi:antirestriction protein ArdC